jgi:hypothetical protein
MAGWVAHSGGANMRPKSIGFCLALTVVGLTGLIGPVGAVGFGMTCGGLAGIQCDTGLWCDHQPNKCGVADASGRCVRIPTTQCPQRPPVCGCNGTTYNGDCERVKAGVYELKTGPCNK